jgi:hypothetical protein
LTPRDWLEIGGQVALLLLVLTQIVLPWWRRCGR